MKKEFNKEKLEKLIHEFLTEVGDDPQRAGLVETPKRAAKAICELFEGMCGTLTTKSPLNSINALRK